MSNPSIRSDAPTSARPWSPDDGLEQARRESRTPMTPNEVIEFVRANARPSDR